MSQHTTGLAGQGERCGCFPVGLVAGGYGVSYCPTHAKAFETAEQHGKMLAWIKAAMAQVDDDMNFSARALLKEIEGA